MMRSLITYGSTIALQSPTFKRYLSAEESGNLSCNSQTPVQNEYFIIEKAPRIGIERYTNSKEQRDVSLGMPVQYYDLIHLRSMSGKFVLADDSGKALCNATIPLLWETFSINSSTGRDHGPISTGATINLFSGQHHRYLVVERNLRVNCDRREPKEFEKFNVILINQYTRPYYNTTQNPYMSQPNYTIHQNYTQPPHISMYPSMQPQQPQQYQLPTSYNTQYPSLPAPAYQTTLPYYQQYVVNTQPQQQQQQQQQQFLPYNPPIQANVLRASPEPSPQAKFESMYSQLKRETVQSGKLQITQNYFKDQSTPILLVDNVISFLREFTLSNYRMESLKSMIYEEKIKVPVDHLQDIIGLYQQDCDRLKSLKVLMEQKDIAGINCKQLCVLLRLFSVDYHRSQALKSLKNYFIDADSVEIAN